MIKRTIELLDMGFFLAIAAFVLCHLRFLHFRELYGSDLE